MTLSQKRAINYAIRDRKNKAAIEYLKSINKYDDFKISKYKYITNYIKFALK